jgi:hypothetical protein
MSLLGVMLITCLPHYLGASFSTTFNHFLLKLFKVQSTSIGMPVSRRLEAHDPKHGSVGDLCRNLGYGSDRKGTPRSKYFLSSKVAVFRKDFLETDADVDLFPLEHESTGAQRCASNFLHQNLHLFQDSGEARVFHYPIYPQDEER